MSTNVVITFQTKPESAAAFAGIIDQVKRDLPRIDGCNGVRAYVRSDSPCVFTLVENWASEMQHKTHIEHVVASGAWEGIAVHLAVDPVSGYYAEI